MMIYEIYMCCCDSVVFAVFTSDVNVIVTSVCKTLVFFT